eukprot:362077-Chlamydomonas_euryale.AAC.7
MGESGETRGHQSLGRQHMCAANVHSRARALREAFMSTELQNGVLLPVALAATRGAQFLHFRNGMHAQTLLRDQTIKAYYASSHNNGLRAPRGSGTNKTTHTPAMTWQMQLAWLYSGTAQTHMAA